LEKREKLRATSMLLINSLPGRQNLISRSISS
jgi:hypothetical protein